MSIFTRWRAELELDRKARQYVAGLFNDPDEADVVWLAQAAANGDEDHARWELRYARRALGLLEAERDALDDLTPSAIARELAAAFGQDRNIDADMVELAERQFNARLSAYRDALASRAGTPPGVLAGRTLLAFAGATFRGEDARTERAAALLEGYLAQAAESLQQVFGRATLPDDLPPSAVARPHG